MGEMLQSLWFAPKRSGGKVSGRREQQDCSQADNCQSRREMALTALLSALPRVLGPSLLRFQPYVCPHIRPPASPFFSLLKWSCNCLPLLSHTDLHPFPFKISLPSSPLIASLFQSMALPFSLHLRFKSWSHSNSSLSFISNIKRSKKHRYHLIPKAAVRQAAF